MERIKYELYPCPFCGGKGAPRRNEFDAQVWWWIKCERCRCETRPVNNPLEAVAVWNTRNVTGGETK